MTNIQKAHKIKLNPAPEQEQYFWRAAGIARYAFKWGLTEYNFRSDYNRKVIKAGIGDKVKISGRLLKKEFNKVKPDWVNDVTCWAYQGAFDDLQAAFTNYWRKFKNGEVSGFRKDGRPEGWPRFKRRNKSTPAFYLANTALKFDDHYVQFDKARVGWVNMAERLRFNGRVLGGRISYRQGHWWLSVQVEMEHEILQHNGDAVGVDFGIKYLAVTSDGEVFDNPKSLIKAQAKLRRFQRKFDRQRRANNPDNFNEDSTVKKGCREWIISNRMRETEKQIIKLHARVANIRQEIAHTMTTSLTNDYEIVCIEDLNIRGMLKNGRLAKHVADAGWYEKRRQLEYKAGFKGGYVSTVDQWFPSSKLCSNPECDYKNVDLTLSIRQWDCPECGQHNHRDGNAAVNIRNEGLRILTE